MGHGALRRSARPALLLLAGLFAGEAMAVEEPKFTAVASSGDFQLRDYAPYRIAETRVESGFDAAGNIAFRRLFGYISGANGGSQKISMTAPVRQEAASDGFTVAFVLPENYTTAQAPLPRDPLIHIGEVPAQRVLALRYSGRWTEALYREKEKELLREVSHRGLQVAGPPVYARYNAPFVPWPFRRNEVLVPVRAGETQAK